MASYFEKMPSYFEKMPKQEISKPQRMRFGLAAMPERKAQELPLPERLKYRSGRCAPPPPYFGHDGGSETIMRQVPAHMPMFLQDNRQGAFLSAATILQQRPDCRTTPICRGKNPASTDAFRCDVSSLPPPSAAGFFCGNQYRMQHWASFPFSIVFPLLP